jgi:hypothetical protein
VTDRGWTRHRGDDRAGAGGHLVHQAPVGGVSVTSVSVAGNYILWADCFPQWCLVEGEDNGSVVSVATSGIPVDVQGDAGAWYWGDSGGLEKFAL